MCQPAAARRDRTVRRHHEAEGLVQKTGQPQTSAAEQGIVGEVVDERRIHLAFLHEVHQSGRFGFADLDRDRDGGTQSIDRRREEACAERGEGPDVEGGDARLPLARHHALGLLRSRDGSRLLVMSTTAERALTPAQRSVIESSCRILPLEVGPIELAGGSVRCMLAGIHLDPRPTD